MRQIPMAGIAGNANAQAMRDFLQSMHSRRRTGLVRCFHYTISLSQSAKLLCNI